MLTPLVPPRVLLGSLGTLKVMVAGVAPVLATFSAPTVQLVPVRLKVAS